METRLVAAPLGGWLEVESEKTVVRLMGTTTTAIAACIGGQKRGQRREGKVGVVLRSSLVIHEFWNRAAQGCGWVES